MEAGRAVARPHYNPPMTNPKHASHLGQFASLAIVVAACLLFGWQLKQPSVQARLFYLTGEERLASQLKGLSDLLVDGLRPRLNLAADAPVRYADLNPFGVNVFLNEEVDPAKREQTVQLAAAAGFQWLRQEFPWQDIEIHGKGDTQDRRNPPTRSAWDKYDQIVDLAGKYHMELIVRLSTPPAWSRAMTDTVGTFAPPDNYEDFGDFVYQVVSRYRGRIRFYQIWNEPNIYPEWGNYSISPEKYTELLKVGATRARAADPNVVIICGALASTIALQPAAPAPTNALNDLIFLQRMYDAGAAPYFDIMAMQDYGLWSGPTDRRMQPRVMNYGRPQFVRDLMVSNGDAGKPIWISEMAWNAVPDKVEDKRFGQVSLEQQAGYEPLAYQRALAEWPWAGVINTWYFKRAGDDWVKQGKPEAYFRLADPDFTLQPVYNSLKNYITSFTPTLYAGTHAPAGWAVQATGRWETVTASAAPYGQFWQSSQPGSKLEFTFSGNSLSLDARCGGPPSATVGGQAGGQAGGPPSTATCGSLRVSVDGQKPVSLPVGGPVRRAGGILDLLPARPSNAGSVVAKNLAQGLHRAVIEVTETSAATPVALAALAVR